MEGEDAEDVVAAGGAEGVQVPVVGQAGGQEVQLRRAEEGLDALGGYSVDCSRFFNSRTPELETQRLFAQ